jgi:integrase/recombinase XerD
MNWETTFKPYLEGLQSRQYSPATLEITGRWLLRLARHCEMLGVASPVTVTVDHLDGFHQTLLWHPHSEGGLYTPNTVDQALRVVRSFFRWAVASQVVLVDPTRHWVLRRVPQPLHVLLTVAEVERLLNVPDTTRPAGVRDRAVLETLYATGLRRLECHRLDVDDIELEGGMVRVRLG